MSSRQGFHPCLFFLGSFFKKRGITNNRKNLDMGVFKMGKIIDFEQAKIKLQEKEQDREIEKFNQEVHSILEWREANMTEEEKRKRRELEEELEKALKGLI